MDSNLLYVGVDAIAIMLMALTVARFLQLSTRDKISWYVLLIGLGVISNILASRQDYGILVDAPFRADFGAWYPIMNLLRNAIAAWFMLICHSIFKDGERTPRILIVVIVAHLFLEEPIEWLIGEEWGSPFWVTTLHEVIPSIIQLMYLGLGVYWTLSERAADLDPVRHKARVFFIAVYLTQAVLSLLVERVAMGYGWIPSEYQYPIHVVLVGVGSLFTLYVVFALMSSNTLTLFDFSIPKEPEEAPLDEYEIELERIRHALEVECIYRQAGLTVAELAVHLGIPEYRLRRLIHQHLGYRNFNALLHHYRIEEVTVALADESQAQTPILTLALSAGYQSINPFNRAFRNAFDMTPSEYRKAAKQKHLKSLKTAPISESDHVS